MLLQAKECQEPPEARKLRKDPLYRVFGGNVTNTLILDFRPLGLERIKFCCFSPHTVVFCSDRPRKPMGFPGGASGKEPACQRRRCERRGFDPWVRKIL